MIRHTNGPLTRLELIHLPLQQMIDIARASLHERIGHAFDSLAAGMASTSRWLDRIPYCEDGPTRRVTRAMIIHAHARESRNAFRQALIGETGFTEGKK